MMSEEFELVEKPEAPARHLSGGDAVVTIALLLFILGWVGGWVYGFTVDPPKEKISMGAGMIWLLIIAGPAIWAGGTISHIIGKRD